MHETVARALREGTLSDVRDLARAAADALASLMAAYGAEISR